MQKTTKRIPVGGKIRHLTTLTGEEVTNMNEKRIRQWNMLRTIADTPDLMTCGPVPFDKMRMLFNGSAWIVEMEAETET